MSVERLIFHVLILRADLKRKFGQIASCIHVCVTANTSKIEQGKQIINRGGMVRKPGKYQRSNQTGEELC